MQCKKGITLKTTGEMVPCGQCISCRLNTGRLWTSRILMEWLSHYEETGQYAYFMTFTYSDEYLPLAFNPEGYPEGTLRKKRFLKWINNAQRDIGAFRYYAVGEYGDQSHRPHYHMAVFPTEPSHVNALRAYWSKGFSQAGEMSPERARYLAAYTVKKLTLPGDVRLGNREPEFRTSSRNPPLGAAFCARFIKHYQTKQGQAEIEERGDVRRTFRFAGAIYPVGGWALKKIRQELGIPLLDRERRLHPRYEDYFSGESAVWEPEISKQIEDSIHAKKNQRHHRSTVERV